MLTRLVQHFRPHPFTDRWLAKNAISHSRKSFEAGVRNKGGVPIFHATDLEKSQSIFQSEKMYGIDVRSSAHFHHTPELGQRQAPVSGVFLGFSWLGAVATVDWGINQSSHNDQRPNVLFNVPLSETSKETWEYRLYPGTTGLSLMYIEMNGIGFLLQNAKTIRVIDSD